MTGITTIGGHALGEQARARMPVKAMTDPTERSMPPVRITKVMPTARTTR